MPIDDKIPLNVWRRRIDTYCRTALYHSSSRPLKNRVGKAWAGGVKGQQPLRTADYFCVGIARCAGACARNESHSRHEAANGSTSNRSFRQTVDVARRLTFPESGSADPTSFERPVKGGDERETMWDGAQRFLEWRVLSYALAEDLSVLMGPGSSATADWKTLARGGGCFLHVHPWIEIQN